MLLLLQWLSYRILPIPQAKSTGSLSPGSSQPPSTSITQNDSEPSSTPFPEPLPTSPSISSPHPSLHIEPPMPGTSQAAVMTSTQPFSRHCIPATSSQSKSTVKWSWFISLSTLPPSPPRHIPSTPPLKYPAVSLSESPANVLPVLLEDSQLQTSL